MTDTPNQSLREEVALKPCPFCGSSDLEIMALDEDTDVVTCNGCNGQGGYYLGDSTDPTEAAEKWNHRDFTPDPETARLAELGRACEAGMTNPPAGWREALSDIANIHFVAGNDKKRKLWERKAHAHAWAGIMEATRALAPFEAGGPFDATTLSAAPQPPAVGEKGDADE